MRGISVGAGENASPPGKNTLCRVRYASPEKSAPTRVKMSAHHSIQNIGALRRRICASLLVVDCAELATSKASALNCQLFLLRDSISNMNTCDRYKAIAAVGPRLPKRVATCLNCW